MKNFLVIYGPTATGKTDLAITLAKKFNGELVSFDSRQVYKNLDIGTGKVSFDAQVEKHSGYWIVNGVKIHGFDLVEPGKRFSVADFLKHTFTSLIRINEVNRLPIVVGGTGFYIKSLIEGIPSIGIPADQKLRSKLEKLSVKSLYQKLVQINRQRAKAMNQSDRANPRRLIRAIEIATAQVHTCHSGVATTTIESRSYHFISLRSRMTEKVLMIGLNAPNQYLYQRADSWLDTRLKHGLVEEVQNLIKSGIKPALLDNLGLEYRWLTRNLLGKVDYDQAIERLRGDIHSFIRRQKTWFRQFPNIHLFDISEPSWRQKLEKTIKG